MAIRDKCWVPSRPDRVRVAEIIASYRALRRVTLQLSWLHETRSSSVAFGDYAVNVVGAGVRIGLQETGRLRQGGLADCKKKPGGTSPGQVDVRQGREKADTYGIHHSAAGRDSLSRELDFVVAARRLEVVVRLQSGAENDGSDARRSSLGQTTNLQAARRDSLPAS